MTLNKEEIQAAIDEQINIAEKRFGKSVKFTLINIISLVKMLQPEQQTEKKQQTIPLSEWNEYREYPSVGTLRQYRHFNTDNFEEVLEWGGINKKRLLINVDKYDEWHRKRTVKSSDITKA